MKYIITLFLVLTSTHCFANQPIKIGVISDTHYLSEKLMDNGQALNKYINYSGRNIKDVPIIIDDVINYYLNIPDLDVLLICGDMTKDGEKQSHIDFVNKLKPLQDKGVKIYVIPGNHDLNRAKATVGYKGEDTYNVEYATPQDFIQIYQNYGYGNTIEKDSLSLSYVSKIDDTTWLLAIDAAEYDRYDQGFVSSGKIKDSTEKWILNILDKAKEQNINVLGMMHWGITEHMPYQSDFFPDYLVTDWKKYSNLLADKGVKAIFTGHFHSNDISAHTSPASNTIYDIETGTLVSYPFAYRLIEYNGNEMNITTQNITSIASNPTLVEDSKKILENLAQKVATNKLTRMGLEDNPDLVAQLAKIISEIFIIHLAGDEQLTDELKNQILALSSIMEASPEDITDFEFDFVPADNNVTIQF